MSRNNSTGKLSYVAKYVRTLSEPPGQDPSDRVRGSLALMNGRPIGQEWCVIVEREKKENDRATVPTLNGKNQQSAPSSSVAMKSVALASKAVNE